MLFIPGNAGSYKQVRPIAAEAANHFYHELQHDGESVDSGIRNLDFFTVDFNEDITAFHGQTMLDQAEYLNEAVRFILSLYTDPTRASRDSDLPDPSSLIILGHSMGGIVGRAMLVQPNYQPNSINTMITMSAPHARPPVTFDGQVVQIYDEINEYWRKAYTQKWANNNPLWHVTLVSIAGGSLDTVVPSDYASIEALVPATHGFTVFSSGIPNVWTSADHQAILWCDQFRKAITRALFDIVDVNRAPQTKPRADRIRILKKHLLTGLEPDAERDFNEIGASSVLAVDDGTSTIADGGRLVLTSLGGQSEPKLHLLPIPSQVRGERRRLTILTNGHVDTSLDILLCRASASQDAGSRLPLSSILNLAGKGKGPSQVDCINIVNDVIKLPASTASRTHPFTQDGERPLRPLSYFQYDGEHLADYRFAAIVDRAVSKTRQFVIAEFSDRTDHHYMSEIRLPEFLVSGLSLRIPATRSTKIELAVPSLQSAILAYDLRITIACRRQPALFAPLVRQYIERPYESKFFVNVHQASISLHGVAPYVPPPLGSRELGGLSLDIWSDPTCKADLDITLTLDVLGSLGKLYMRYRTIFAAFPLLIVTLVLRKQFQVYDSHGTFISFSEGLDMSLRRSIPLLLISLTLLSLSMGNALVIITPSRNPDKTSAPAWVAQFHKNDLLMGTEDPFFWFLVPVIGLVSVGVCAMLHYFILTVTYVFAVIYRLLPARTAPTATTATSVLGFSSAEPRRRIITAAALLFLVSTFIPYQFAYLVCCLVQLFTVIRALRAEMLASSPTSCNFYHYAHSILLLMLWVLPINLPILAVWVRNLTVHWLTPFSSHHNVLSIMPFIFLVENLTTGRMIPQVRPGLRYVTSTLLFFTALCAAIFGVSHAYMLHYLVNIVAAWLVIVHSTSEPWSLSGIGAMFDGDATYSPKKAEKP